MNVEVLQSFFTYFKIILTIPLPTVIAINGGKCVFANELVHVQWARFSIQFEFSEKWLTNYIFNYDMQFESLISIEMMSK